MRLLRSGMHYKVSAEFPGWERVDWGIGEGERIELQRDITK